MLSIAVHIAHRRKNTMGIILRFVAGILLLCIAQILLGITQFNENYVFANPGLVEPTANNLSQWFTVAQQHSGQLLAAVLPFDHWLSADIFTIVMIIAFPPFLIIFWPGAKKIHYFVLAALLVLVAVDVNNLLTFNGNSSGNGGYDGLDDFACYLLHLLLGAFCVFLAATRGLRVVFDRFRSEWQTLNAGI